MSEALKDERLLCIKSNKAIATLSLKAGEVYYFGLLNDSYNYVWSGDSNYWGGRNPILFPQVSSTDNKTVLINGKYYPMGNHGFVRHSTFPVFVSKEDEITMSMVENEDTLKQYPFHFELSVNYKLIDTKLLFTYTIKNTDDKVMPFGFGLHPAFACPKGYRNTYIEFEKEEDIGKKIIINEELFKKYSTVRIDQVKSTYAILHADDKNIKVGFEKYKILAIWSKGPFICIEPWMNETEKDHMIEMKDRKDILELKPGEEKQFTYYWEII